MTASGAVPDCLRAGLSRSGAQLGRRIQVAGLEHPSIRPRVAMGSRFECGASVSSVRSKAVNLSRTARTDQRKLR